MKALVVEDDLDIRSLLTLMLGGMGWSVAEAPDGETALEHDVEGLDLVVLDYKMPRLSGDDVAKLLRARGYAGPIILFSAFLTDELKSRMEQSASENLHVISKTDFGGLRDFVKGLEGS